MNGQSELETLLRSWKLRHPSPGVKRRIFADGAAGDGLVVERHGPAAVEPAPFRLGWFAPATLSLLVACVLFNHHNSFILSDSAGAGPLVAAALSNQSAAAWLPGSFERAQNSLPILAVDWTNMSRRNPSPGWGGTN